MRKIFIFLAFIIVLTVPLAAAGDPEPVPAFRSDWSIVELAEAQKVPLRKLAEVFGKSLDVAENRTLRQLGISEEQAEKALSRYRAGEKNLVANMVLVGMAIVFGSLVLVAFLISLLRHLHIFRRPMLRSDSDASSVGTVIGTIISSGDLSDYSIAAVVTAVFLHETEVEAENKLLLTWRRAPMSRWKTVDLMPNSQFITRRGR
jgi:hypothetical protein